MYLLSDFGLSTDGSSIYIACWAAMSIIVDQYTNTGTNAYDAGAHISLVFALKASTK